MSWLLGILSPWDCSSLKCEWVGVEKKRFFVKTDQYCDSMKSRDNDTALFVKHLLSGKHFFKCSRLGMAEIS
jgi:hypothetical protein